MAIDFLCKISAIDKYFNRDNMMYVTRGAAQAEIGSIDPRPSEPDLVYTSVGKWRALAHSFQWCLQAASFVGRRLFWRSSSGVLKSMEKGEGIRCPNV